ncbi:cationic amino acid transporter 6, chloroplastic-like protein [Tanacetum coccineum]
MAAIRNNQPATPNNTFFLSGYFQTLSKTPKRLRKRVLATWTPDQELNQMRLRSGADMKRKLTWYDLIALGVGGMLGVGVFVTTGPVARDKSGPAVLVSYVIAGISALFSSLCYTEFSIQIPVAGGAFSYLRVTFGEFVGYLAGANILMEYVLSNAAVARSFTEYLCTTFGQEDPNAWRIEVDGLAKGYNMLDFPAVALIVLLTLCLCRSFDIGLSAAFRFRQAPAPLKTPKWVESAYFHRGARCGRSDLVFLAGGVCGRTVVVHRDRIDPLGRWQKKMHFLLSSMSVVYVLTTPIPEDGENATVDQLRRMAKWDNDDYVCRGLILNDMSDPLFNIYQNVESSKELWDSLEAKYMAEDVSSKKFLVSNFTNYRMTDSRPVMEQYNELLVILERFTQHKMNMDEAIQVFSIIEKLPPSWKNFKYTLKHRKGELNLVELGSHLRIEESLRV